MSFKSVIDVLLSEMLRAGKFKHLKGEQKKELVLLSLEGKFELDEDLERLLMYIIDILIKVENGELVFNQKISETFNFCCSKRK